MGIMTLEKEFEIQSWRHKTDILKAMLIRYYQDLKDTNTKCLSEDIKNNSAQDLAENELYELLLRDDDGIEFNRLYKFGWDIVKEYLP